MNDAQFWTIVGMLGAGFGWIIHQISGLDKRLSSVETRVTVVETRLGFVERLLEMLNGIKINFKEKTDP